MFPIFRLCSLEVFQEVSGREEYPIFSPKSGTVQEESVDED